MFESARDERSYFLKITEDPLEARMNEGIVSNQILKLLNHFELRDMETNTP